jgi:hypothetical protein
MKVYRSITLAMLCRREQRDRDLLEARIQLLLFGKRKRGSTLP